MNSDFTKSPRGSGASPFLSVTGKDLDNTAEIEDAMRASFGLTSIRTVFFVAIETNLNGFAIAGTSHVDGARPPCRQARKINKYSH